MSSQTEGEPRTGGAPEPPVLVRLAPLLAGLFPDCERVLPLHVASVLELVDELDARWPGMRDCVCDSSPAIRRHINVFVRGRRVGLQERLQPGDDVFILTAISGG
jgi:molybdopterin converting factor small subunit